MSEDLGSSPGFVVNSGWWLPYSIYSIKKTNQKHSKVQDSDLLRHNVSGTV